MNTTGAISGAGTAYTSETSEFTPSFSGVRASRCFLCVDRCLFFSLYSFGHSVVCPSSIYGFWLALFVSSNSSYHRKIIMFKYISPHLTCLSYKI